MKLDIVLYGKTSEVVIGELPQEKVKSLLVTPFDIYQPDALGDMKWWEIGTFYHNNGLLLKMEDEPIVADIHHDDKKVEQDVTIPQEQLRIEDVKLAFTIKELHSGVLCGSVKEGVIYFVIDDVPDDYDIAKLCFHADRIEGQGILIYRVSYGGEQSYQEEYSSSDHMIEPVFFK